MSGIVYARSLRIDGNHMDEAIMNYVKRKYNLLIGEGMAEKVKMEIGSAAALEKPVTMEVKGRSLIEGVPKTITADDSEIREALSESVNQIVSGIRVALERTPPELGRPQRPWSGARRRWSVTQESRSTDPRRNLAPGVHC